MATAKGANTYNRQNWEDAEFPILCQTCLGDNPYIRMTKDKYGRECKICMRPFTVFRWCPGAKCRFKKTEVCQTCSKLKNVCQTCLLDLEYGLPVQVRDKALKIIDEMPKSDVNKEYYTQNMEREMALGDGTSPGGAVGKVSAHSDMLLKLARTTPYYKRNRPHICSFWVKGECKRGEECPYRHEKPSDPDDPLANQNMKDRFYGIADPVAEKMMERYNTMPALELPEDKSITTLYAGNLGDKVTEQELRDHFWQFGEIRSISMQQKQQYAFIQYTTRDGAEKAAEKSFNKLILQGRRITIKWGHGQGAAKLKEKGEGEEPSGEARLKPVQGLPPALPMPPGDDASGSGGPPRMVPPRAMLPPPPPQGFGGNFFGLNEQMYHPMLRMRMMGPPQLHPGMMHPRMRGPPPGVMPMRGPPPPGGPPVPPMMMGGPPMIPMRPVNPPAPGTVNYPSQDPSRMGAPGTGGST